ncbi:unnamed protein product [Clavelina lepadiformis]|uniref:Uncharacterized protein n=1 Tax=Clavelina lepadiformis TaxID=159417 RepID=A0ABP0GGX2_CLALP
MDPIKEAHSLSKKKKLKIIDKEIHKLYVACKDSGYSAQRIKELAQPIIHAAQQGSQKRFRHKCVKWAVICSVIFGFLCWSPTNYATKVVTRKFMVNYILPYYDWTSWYDDCFLYNPYYKSDYQGLLPEECEVCKNLKNLTELHNVNMSYMEDLIFRMEPALVGDAMHDWKSMHQSVTLNDIFEIYKTNTETLSNEKLCGLRVSKGLQLDNATILDLIEKVHAKMKDGEHGNFTSYWTTCHKDSAKEMHKLYYTPYFLPGMCEPVQNKNFLLLGRKAANTSKILAFKTYDGENAGSWFAQLHGSMHFILKAQDTCKDICPRLEVYLQKGQILNVPNERLYLVAFRPHSKEAVAIGTSYTHG